MTTLPIALTFDLDPDVFDASIDSASHRNSLTWFCITHGIPRIHAALHEVAWRGAKAISSTWFVRVDNQIAATYGRPAHLLTEFSSIFAEATQGGDEIAWHPHLYRHTESGWRQEVDDRLLDERLEAALEDMRSLGYNPQCSRIGEAYGSVGIMASLSRLGIKFDATAMAGRRRVDDQRIIDWLPTPPKAYRPSRADHRVPGKPDFPVVEIPMSMLSVKASYDEKPLLRYLDLSFHPAALADGLPALVGEAPYLVAMTHPSALLQECRPSRPHGLLSYDVAGFVENLRAIISAAAGAGRRVEFVTVAELGERIRAQLDG